MTDRSPKDSQNFTKIKTRLDMKIFKGDQIHISKYLYKPLGKLIITLQLSSPSSAIAKYDPNWSLINNELKITFFFGRKILVLMLIKFFLMHEENNEEGFRVSCSTFKTPTIHSFQICCKRAKQKVMLRNQGSIGLFPQLLESTTQLVIWQ